MKIVLTSVLKICEKSLFPDSLNQLMLSADQLKYKTLGLIQLGLKKIHNFKIKEQRFKIFQWGPTRPTDLYLFNS